VIVSNEDAVVTVTTLFLLYGLFLKLSAPGIAIPFALIRVYVRLPRIFMSGPDFSLYLQQRTGQV